MIQIIAQALLFVFALIGVVSASIKISEWWRTRNQENQIDPRELDKQSRGEERDELKSDILRTLLNEIKYNHEILERGLQKRTRYFLFGFLGHT